MVRIGTSIALAGLLGLTVAAAELASPRIHSAAAPRGGTSMADGARRFVVAPSGNEARYRVREQLAKHDLPNDAVGKTGAVTGALVIGADGTVIPGESKIVVDVTGLTSDQRRRDGYVQRRLLQTDQYPTVQLVPTAVQGLPVPLPVSGDTTFRLVGNLTVHGVTHPTEWRVSAHFAPGRITGTSVTHFTFDDFGLTQPRLSFLLSVADTIALEYDFTLVVDSTSA